MENEMMIKPADKPAETTDSMLTRLASEINAIKEQTRKTVYLAMMDIGQRLLQAKGAVGHGNWEKWLKENVDYSPRTAQRLIASYERFGDGQQKLFGRSADPEQLAELNKTQIMTLMSIKDEEKCFEFMDEHKEEIKDMSKTELEAIAKELNDTVAELNSTKHKLDIFKSTANSFQKRLADREGVIEAYQKQVSELKSQLDEAGESQELADLKTKYAALQRDLARADKQHEQIAEEAGKYQNLFEESQQKVDALSKELEEAKSQPIEAATVEKIVEVEKVPEETKKQLEMMQARIRELEAVGKDTKTPEEKAFGRHLMNVKSELEASITQLMAIQDEEKKRKYAALLRKLLQGTLSMTSWAVRMTKSLYVSIHSNIPIVIGIAKIISFDKNGIRHETYGRVGQRSDNGRISKPKYTYDDWMTAQDELDRYADKMGLCWLKNNRALPQIVFDDYTKDTRGCLFEGELKQINTSWRTRWKIITK